MTSLQEVPMVQMGWENPPPVKCWVYEVWDDKHRLAYAGIAENFERRWHEHVAKSWWLGEINVWYIDVFGYRSRWDARQVEASMINDQHAVYNTSREENAYRAYHHRWTDDARFYDDFDCTPIAKRRFIPVPNG